MDTKTGLGRALVAGLALVSAAGLGGCAGIADGEMFSKGFWASSPTQDNIEAELGLAELAKGNYVEAESRFKKALDSNPQDIHALLGMGIMYQNNGQATRARAMYEAIIAVRPDEGQQFVVWNNIATRPLLEIASVNLALLESGGVLSGMGRGAAGGEQAYQPGAEPAGGRMATMAGAGQTMPGPGGVSGAPTGSALLGRVMPARTGAGGMANPQAGGGGDVQVPRFADGDNNIMSRFTSLAALRDQGLITRDEFEVRRQANVGAMLPLTSPPSAAGLDRPVPSSEQISGRLRAIGRALEMRAITVGQHAAERSMILDALMPSAPVVVANPAPPPQGLMEAADAVRRLELLQQRGFITSDEYSRERQAVELSMQPPPMPMPKQAMPQPASRAAGAPTELAAKPQAPSGPAPGVHLSSYRSEKAANEGWATLKRSHAKLLGGLKSSVERVDIKGKGVFFRLKVGPFDSDAKARDMCRQLKGRRQYCEPTKVNLG